MERVTFEQLVADKHISEKKREKDLQNLVDYPADENKRSFAGNKYLYHYQMANLAKTHVGNRPSLYEIMNDDRLYAKLYSNAMKLKRTGNLANRLFEAERFNGAVVFFKPTTAKWLYKKYGATKVLDPTAGWGGRMLGAWALGIEYTGIDTNTELRPAYNAMMDELGHGNLNMIWKPFQEVDFSKIDYDFVLTSPPYVNLEVYEHMTPYASNKAFYDEFLKPMIQKCLDHITPGGRVCINISPKMYADLIKFGFRECDDTEDLLQQKRLGKNKEDKIYIWIRPKTRKLKKFGGVCHICGGSKDEEINYEFNRPYKSWWNPY